MFRNRQKELAQFRFGNPLLLAADVLALRHGSERERRWKMRRIRFMIQPASGRPVRPVVGCRLVIIGREKDTKTATTPPRPVTRGKRRRAWSLSLRCGRRSAELACSYYAIPAVGAEKDGPRSGLAMRAMVFHSGVARFGEIMNALARGRCISAASPHHELCAQTVMAG